MHELTDAVESLTYWRRRAGRLPWYRVGARREAREMARRWEARVATAALWTPGAPLRARFAAGLAVAGARIERVRLKRLVVVTTAVVTTLLLVPVVLTALVLIQLF